jgi:hypothetical protein
MEKDNTFLKCENILCQQMQLLAEKSKTVTEVSDLVSLTSAMVETAKALKV